MGGKYPFFKQHDQRDCGPACIRMISKYYGKTLNMEEIRKQCLHSVLGVSLWSLSNASTHFGFRTLYARITFDNLAQAMLPCVVHFDSYHFIVVYKIKRNKVIVGDPAIGLLTYDKEEFLAKWVERADENGSQGIVLLLEPMPNFYLESGNDFPEIGLGFFLQYLKGFKKYYVQLILGMLVTLGFSLVLPFLTQSMVDVGINTKNIGFINLILLAQLTFSISSTVLDFIKSWIFLHMGSRINIAMISDYLIKLLKLPVSFFEKKMVGDILQRIGDHNRIQTFISSTTLTAAFSLLNFTVFSCIMAYYSLRILAIFLVLSSLYACWIFLFLKKRKEFDYKFFERNSIKQNALIQLLYGIRDIKLHNYEDRKRWEWERIQAQTFKISVKSLLFNQYQQTGAFFIETTKNILVSYLAAKSVIDGQMTLGMMLSMQFILGQISGPIMQLTGLINAYQDLKISLERIGEIHLQEDEEKSNITLSQIPINKGIKFDNVSFSYAGSKEQPILKNVSFKIDPGTTTAIVGPSGCGKTSILKLLLKFYTPDSGRITVGNMDIRDIPNREWREICGAVLQDGFIFSDTILENVILGDEEVTYNKLVAATTAANINEYVEGLPNGYRTPIGQDGHGISQGQRQRILIARAVYRNPSYLFLDEATNSLDSKNESDILANLNARFHGKTIICIAHRLSTIRDADQIIVMEDGSIAEIGTHDHLIAKEGVYFNLIKKQAGV